MKRFTLLLLAMTGIICGSFKAQAVTTVEWTPQAGASLSSIAMDQNITLSWMEGGGDQAPSVSGNYVYFYNGNRVSLTAKSGQVITKVVFGFTGERYSLVTCDASGKNENSTGISTNAADMTCTWTGESAQLYFRASRQTGERKITSVSVTYKAEGEVVETKAELAITSQSINTTADLDNTPAVTVNYKNTGDAATINAKATLYVDGAENASAAIGAIGAGATGWKTLYYDASKIAAGEHQVYIALTADNADEVKTEPVTVTFTKKAPEASFSLEVSDVSVAYDQQWYSFIVKVTNTSEVDATGVAIELLSGTTVVDSKTIDVPAGQTVETSLVVDGGPFEAGTKEYQVMVARKVSKWVKAVIEEAPAAEVRDLAITEVLGTIDLANESSYVRVTVQNNGTVDISDAPVVLTAGSKTLGNGTISAKAGQAGWAQVAVAAEGLEAGELSVTAKVTVEGDATPADNTMEATLTVKAAPVPEATFSVTAEDVSVPFGAKSFSIEATVKNTSETAGKEVQVRLLKGITEVETKTIASLAAGAETKVSFNIAEMGEPGKTATYFVQVANQVQAEVVVTFEEEPVAEVKDLAITEVLGTIDLAAESNSIRVTVQNNGTADISDAPVVLTVVGGSQIGSATVSAKAGQTGWCMVAVDAKDLTEGELAVQATVTVEGDATPADNTLQATVTVKGTPAAAPEFTISGSEAVTTVGAKSFQVKLSVANVGSIDAENVTVYVTKDEEVLGSTTIEKLVQGATETVTVSVNNPYMEAGEYNDIKACVYYDKVLAAEATVNVTVNAPAVQEVVDLAVTSVTGTIDLALANNYVTVFVENKGTVDVVDAAVTITAGTTVLGTGTVSVKAGQTAVCSVVISTESLTEGSIEVVAKVTAADDADTTDNELTKTIEVTAATAISSVKAAVGESATVFTLDGKRVSTVRKGRIYIVRPAEGRLQGKNGKKLMVK